MNRLTFYEPAVREGNTEFESEILYSGETNNGPNDVLAFPRVFDVLAPYDSAMRDSDPVKILTLDSNLKSIKVNIDVANLIVTAAERPSKALDVLETAGATGARLSGTPFNTADKGDLVKSGDMVAFGDVNANRHITFQTQVAGKAGDKESFAIIITGTFEQDYQDSNYHDMTGKRWEVKVDGNKVSLNLNINNTGAGGNEVVLWANAGNANVAARRAYHANALILNHINQVQPPNTLNINTLKKNVIKEVG